MGGGTGGSWLHTARAYRADTKGWTVLGDRRRGRGWRGLEEGTPAYTGRLWTENICFCSFLLLGGGSSRVLQLSSASSGEKSCQKRASYGGCCRLLQCAACGLFSVASHPALGLQSETGAGGYEGNNHETGEGMPVPVRIPPSNLPGPRKRPSNLQKKKNLDAIFLSRLFPLVSLFNVSVCFIDWVEQTSNDLEQILQTAKMASSGESSSVGSAHDRTSNQDLSPTLPFLHSFSGSGSGEFDGFTDISFSQAVLIVALCAGVFWVRTLSQMQPVACKSHFPETDSV